MPERDIHITGDQEGGTVDVHDALRLIRSGERRTPSIALILGSGLGAIADDLDQAQRFPTTALPGYPRSSVAGHEGSLVIGELKGVEVAVFKGRVHCYEGYDASTVAFPVRLAHALGADTLILTNAAGGIGTACTPGSIMLISDHLNMTFRSPSSGPAFSGKRLPSPYDSDWLARAAELGRRLGLPVSTGVYVWTLGPSYETKAEISYYRTAGADAVGMSTVPEAVQARRLGMSVLGISTITNAAAGLQDGELSHEDVLAVGASVQEILRRYIHELVIDAWQRRG